MQDMSTTSKVMVGARWVILSCNPSNKCHMCAWITCTIAAIGCIVYKRGESKGMHAYKQNNCNSEITLCLTWNLTLGCAWFSKRIYIYVHDCYLNGWCIGHRANLRRVVIGWTMTFKNIKFSTCLSFSRIRISSLCHMWLGKFLVT
jgi:hypothetical protein